MTGRLKDKLGRVTTPQGWWIPDYSVYHRTTKAHYVVMTRVGNHEEPVSLCSTWRAPRMGPLVAVVRGGKGQCCKRCWEMFERRRMGQNDYTGVRR